MHGQQLTSYLKVLSRGYDHLGCPMLCYAQNLNANFLKPLFFPLFLSLQIRKIMQVQALQVIYDNKYKFVGWCI